MFTLVAGRSDLVADVKCSTTACVPRTALRCAHRGSCWGFAAQPEHDAPPTVAPTSSSDEEECSVISFQSASQCVASSTGGPSSEASNCVVLALIRPAAFPETYPTVCFCTDGAAGCVPLRRRRMQVRFRGVANAAIRRVFASAGFQAVAGAHWDVLWGSPLKAEQLAKLNAFQRHNHFSSTWQLGRKDNLYRHDPACPGVCAASAAVRTPCKQPPDAAKGRAGTWRACAA